MATLPPDPDFHAELEERRELVERGEAVIHDDAEVRRRLRDLGVPLVGPGPTE